MRGERGQSLTQAGSDPVDAALSFYQALKVYPQPRELINIYDKTVPKVCRPTVLYSYMFPVLTSGDSPFSTSWPK